MLPPLPSGSQATWKAGTAYEVGWTVAANHGGGYSYRMAPADGPLTEATFGKMALDFVGNSTLRWDGPSNLNKLRARCSPVVWHFGKSVH